jgi:hypothetical protein
LFLDRDDELQGWARRNRMPLIRSFSRRSVVIAMVMLAAACGDEPSATAPSSSADPGPVPAAMCPAGSSPVVAAYDLETGGFRWAACAPGDGSYFLAAASDDTVWVTGGPPVTGLPTPHPQYVSYDAATGEELWRDEESRFRNEVPADADRPVESPPLIDGVQLSGGQDDPMTGIDAASGQTLWTQPGHMVYDDVWAVGDDAVFAFEYEFPQPPALAGYEVATGEVRWRRELPPAGPTAPAPPWPWHVTGDRLLAMWTNLEVVATDDGSVRWETGYPEPTLGFPRMHGGLANSHSVFVSFTTVRSGGD